MAVLSKFIECCCIHSAEETSSSEKCLNTNTGPFVPYKDSPSKVEIADDVIAKIFAAERNDAALQADLQSTIHAYGWYDGLAATILAALENAIKTGKEMAPAVKSAYEKSVTAMKKIEEWAEEHPEMAVVITTLVALGILALMIPWLMAYLGFAEEGIVEGKVAICHYNKILTNV